MVSSKSCSTRSVLEVDPPQAKFVAQMIVLGAQAVGRAFSQALRQEYQGIHTVIT